MATKIGEQLKSVFLKCTSAFTLDGEIVTPGALVEMLEDDAKSLLARGKAVLATIEHAIEAGLVGADALEQDDAEPAAATAPEQGDAGAAPADAATVPADAGAPQS